MDGNGLRYEIAEVHRCVTAGLTEIPTMPLAETEVVTAMDDIRSQIGLRCHGEQIRVT